MKIQFLGAAREVTGSCTLLEFNGRKILVDCGMEQGADTYENTPLPIAPGEIDCVFVTHAHIDHSGKLPNLVSNGFNGKIYATAATANLCAIMLLDSAHIQEQEAFWRNKRAKRSGNPEYIPLYTAEDVQKTIPLFEKCYYNTEYEIYPDLKIRFIDAGHLLGSSSIEITFFENGEEHIILFSGDIGNIDRPLIKDPTLPSKADYVVIESTYGNRLHDRREDYTEQMVRIIDDTMERGGNLVIPSFAVGRTQELLYLLHNIKKNKLTKYDFPVYVDSPLCVEATEIYSAESELIDYYDEETLRLINNGEKILSFPGLKFSRTSEESMLINADNTPKIIISASGMCEAGRIRHHLKHNLWRKDSTILFVGYQAEGTLGRHIINGADKIKLFGEEIMVRAKIETIKGISGHADSDMLMNWLKNIKVKPKAVFVNHGSETSAEDFSNRITDEIGVQAVAPYNGSIYDLLQNKCIAPGNTVKIVKKHSGAYKPSSAYERLLMAGKRLMTVIERNKYGANKDLGKFADRIIELCNKWDR